MKKIYPLILVTVVALGGWLVAQAAEEPQPLKVLLVAGGCCHDYEAQKDILKAGIESKINATVEIEYNPDSSTEVTFPIYENADWADGYDVIIHNECAANVTDPEYVNRILDAHRKGVPAVNLHCAMHSYRWGEFKEPVKLGADNAGWYEMNGIQSTSHGPKTPIDLTITNKTHPITKTLSDWTTIDEELYNNLQIFDNVVPLIRGDQMQPPRKKKGQPADPNAKPIAADAVVAWTNKYGPNETRIFSTTIGHFNDTVADERYLELVTRGLLWSVDKLDKEGNIATGYARD